MSADKHTRKDLHDLTAKLQDARTAAATPAAGERDKADLKLLEQEVAAQKLKARRPEAPAKPAASHGEAKLDKALEDSFPGSDPVSSLEPDSPKKK